MLGQEVGGCFMRTYYFLVIVESLIVKYFINFSSHPMVGFMKAGIVHPFLPLYSQHTAEYLAYKR